MCDGTGMRCWKRVCIPRQPSLLLYKHIFRAVSFLMVCFFCQQIIFIALNIQMFLLSPDIIHLYDSVSLCCMFVLLWESWCIWGLLAVLDYLTGDNWEKLHYQHWLLQLIASINATELCLLQLADIRTVSSLRPLTLINNWLLLLYESNVQWLLFLYLLHANTHTAVLSFCLCATLVLIYCL